MNEGGAERTLNGYVDGDVVVAGWIFQQETVLATVTAVGVDCTQNGVRGCHLNRIE